MPTVAVAAPAVEARPAGGTAQGAAAAELTELRVREMSYNMLSGTGEQHNTRGTPQTKVPVTGTRLSKVPRWCKSSWRFVLKHEVFDVLCRVCCSRGKPSANK